MNTFSKTCLIVMGLMFGLNSCATVPETGRRQLILVSDEQAAQLGTEAYEKIKSEKPISNDSRFTIPVTRAGQRIAQMSGEPNLPWEFNVFVDDTPNAFALPGGKVGVHTGMFDIAKTEAQLAAVMAHEVGHVIARHSAERISSQVLVQAGVGAAGGSDELADAATLGLILPFSRSQESEADEIGLLLMARAGYDPRAAIELWQNMEAAGGGRTPEFLSTHPSPGSRIQRLQEAMPRAMDEYQQSPFRS